MTPSRRYLRFAFLLAAVSAFVGCDDGSVDEGPGEIDGTVVEATDEGAAVPVAGVEVTTMPPTGVAVTGEDGTFELVAIPPGSYVLEARRECYVTESVNVSVRANTSVEADVTLEPTPPMVFPLPSDVAHRASFTYGVGTLSAGAAFAGSKTQLSRGVINDDRFDPADIASARIAAGSVELNLDFPGGPENEIAIDQAALTLSAAPGVGPKVVARDSGFSLAILTTNAQLRREVLELVDADITDYIRQDSFTGTLTLNVAGAGTDAYQFTVNFDVELTVEIADPDCPS